MENQKQKVETLLKLIKENPNIPIVPMVDIECCFDDSYSYWMAEWGSAKLDKYYIGKERFYSYNEDFDRLVDDWIDNNFEKYENLSDQELGELAKSIVNGYEWEEAIIVYINRL
jgi:hypothetical protein